MKFFERNEIVKKILIFLISIVIISNFVTPNYVQAATSGEKMVSGLFYLIAKLGDVGISLMQKFMTGEEEIVNEDNFEIKYSPGRIFANEIDMLKINFINASASDSTLTTTETVEKIEITLDKTETFTPTEDISSQDTFDNAKVYLTEEILNVYGFGGQPDNTIGKLEDVLYYNIEATYPFEWPDNDEDDKWYKATFETKAVNADNGIFKYIIHFTIREKVTETITTTVDTPAYALQSSIATWYKALRTIALVGLLSVLVYLGIRIILSSASAQNKAKYKNMLKDWIVAICILFMLHYAMALMLKATDKINSIISVGMDDSDPLMSSIREQVGDNYEDANIGLTAGYTVMYLALVILTGVFTFQYLKRVIYVAFLTMIAPMIALTYPLDKVKDGKAQAFSFWLREYIFNCLIQPVHLLLYTVLITSAITVAENNILYAIVALAFLVPAEKFIKKMFGLDSQSPVGTLSAAAGGAMVMNMLNKLKGKPPKGEKGGEGGGTSGGTGVRTATANNNSGGASSNGNNSQNANGGRNNTTGGSVPLDRANNSGANNVETKKTNIGRGLKNAGRNIGIKGVDAIKSTGGRLIKSAPGAVIGGTIGLAATVASGGENALGFMSTGISAGSALSSNALGSVHKFNKDTFAEYQKGKYGIEEYNNRKVEKEFYKSEGYKQMTENASLVTACGGEEGLKVATKNFLRNGITDPNEMTKAIKSGITGDEYKAFTDAGITNPKEMASAKVKWGSLDNYVRVKKAAQIAKDKTKLQFMIMARDMGMTSYEAKKVYENMLDLL